MKTKYGKRYRKACIEVALGELDHAFWALGVNIGLRHTNHLTQQETNDRIVDWIAIIGSRADWIVEVTS